MKINLSGKKAIVTGSSAGIGWGCARGLAEAGATVMLTGRMQKSLASARDRLLPAVQGATVRSVAADLSQASGCDALVAAGPACDILRSRSNSIKTNRPRRGNIQALPL